MKENRFRYDNSMAVSGGPYWPQSKVLSISNEFRSLALDYRPPWPCTDQYCPQQSHKGLWQFPINEIIRTDGKKVTMMRSAIRVRLFLILILHLQLADSPEGVSEMIYDNFNRSMAANRAPFIITMDTDFLTSLPDSGAVNALEKFLATVFLFIGF